MDSCPFQHLPPQWRSMIHSKRKCLSPWFGPHGWPRNGPLRLPAGRASRLPNTTSFEFSARPHGADYRAPRSESGWSRAIPI
ncbi:MAG: hypothetical protein QOE16_2785 [Microbacteriaceae bacterium]|nr:hypothetical protein [Microbacteriaceae bacterium]